MKRNGSSVVPYIVVGSAVGGALGYLFGTESGRKVRRAVTRPGALNENIDDAREFLEGKAQKVTGQVRIVLDRAKASMEAGQRAFRDASEKYQCQFQRIEGKNNDIASSVHKTVDSLNKAAGSIEETILDPLYEAGALYRGIATGIKTFISGKGRVREFQIS
ncbi:MAG TPA: YtxH domain-containing protein [Terriglobia bacterium]|nr:YtxH domain-containing protein [Terriglobia bacterium]